LQATPVFAIADFAAVSAAGTLLPPGWLNATVDCSIKYLAPADGETLLARGRVIQASKLLTVARADVFSCREGQELLCATMLATARNLAPAQ
jgi:acyl-coenzyme A thioesterase PaaI-like protein